MTRVIRTPTDVLARLLHPYSPSKFCSDIWQKAPLYVPGPADKFASILTLDQAYELLSDPEPDWQVVEPDRRGNRERIRLGNRDPFALLEQGRDIHLTDIEHFGVSWTRFAETIRAETGHLGGVHLIIILTVAKEPVPLHFDGRGVINMQLAGKKRWRVAPEVAVSWPHRYGQLHSSEVYKSVFEEWQYEMFRQLPESHALEEFVMTPGDLMYVPSGLWHEISEIVETPSLSLLVGFNSFSLFSLMKDTLEREVTNREIRPHIEADEGALLQMRDRLADSVRAISPDELVSTILRARAVSPSLTNSSIAEVRGEPEPAEINLLPDTIVQHAYLGPMYARISSSPDPCTEIFHGPHCVSFEPDEAHLFQLAEWIVKSRTFSLQEAIGATDLSWDEVRSVVERLIESGVLILANDSPEPGK